MNAGAQHLLASYGWTEQRAAALGSTGIDSVARVTSVRERISEVITESGLELVWNALPPARLQIAAGDWAVLTERRYERAQPQQPSGSSRRQPADRSGSALRAIVEILPRESSLRRRLVGSPGGDSVVAANVDRVVVVAPLAPQVRDVALLRYLALSAESDAAVQVALTKADLHPQPSQELNRARRVVAPDHDVAAVSAVTGGGLAALDFPAASTVVLIGPSGAGKSTLINSMFGNHAQETRAVSRHGIGRHTTTTNQLHRLPSGALLLDTPGLHDLGGSISTTTIGVLFSDVLELATSCQLPRCSHTTEPGCAIRQATDTDQLPPARLDLYRQQTAHAHPDKRPRQRPRGRRTEASRRKDSR